MKLHDVQKIEFDGFDLILTVDGDTYQVDLASVSDRLARAGEAARRSYSISPSGYGIHWPAVDEDLSVDGLIAAAKAAYPRAAGEEAAVLREEKK